MAKPLVFVHGFACTHADWQPLVAHFGAHHPAFAPDLRGHGATHARPEDCSIETFGAAQIEIIPGTGHFPQLEAPQSVSRYLAALIGA